MALHDIQHEYVSKYIIDHLKVELKLSPFNSNVLEWRMVAISFYTRFIYFIFNILVLLYFIRKAGIIKNVGYCQIKSQSL
jgi:hypothetical protein